MKQKKFKNTVNLADPKFGSKIIYKTDQFFGAASRILNSQKAIFKEGIYDHHGKWMDGWETRRKRTKNFDWVILKFGFTGIVNKIVIDTSHFKGNYPDSFSIQAFNYKNNININKLIKNSFLE